MWIRFQAGSGKVQRTASPKILSSAHFLAHRTSDDCAATFHASNSGDSRTAIPEFSGSFNEKKEMGVTKITLIASIGAFLIGSASVASDMSIPAVANSRAAFKYVDGGDTDSANPEGYSPLGIAKINGIRVAVNILENGARTDDIAGAGRGFADVFDGDGHLIRRFTFRENLNSPPRIIEYVSVPPRSAN
jgi:hypothetical protein